MPDPTDQEAVGVIRRLATQPAPDPRREFENPLSIVHATEARYEDRLAVLQSWRARLAEEADPDPDAEEAVADAIRALEQGAALRQDQPDEAPKTWGYGVTPMSRGATDGAESGAEET